MSAGGSMRNPCTHKPVTAIGRAESLWPPGCWAATPIPSRSATDAYRIWHSPSRRSARSMAAMSSRISAQRSAA